VETYEPRSFRFIELITIGDWQLKNDGKNACVVFGDYWGNENELFHHVFLCRSSDPDAFIPAKDSDSSVCVWDLRLQSFEREAWIKRVLCEGNAPHFQAYLDERLNDDVLRTRRRSWRRKNADFCAFKRLRWALEKRNDD